MDEETLKAKGLEDSSLASNLGILFVGIAIMILIVIGIFCIAKLASKSKRVQGLVEIAKEKLFWNSFLRYLI